MTVAFLFYLNIVKECLTLNEKAREAYNAYMREWRAKNKDKVKAAQERCWNKKSQEIREGV
jgi:cell division protein ZapA (FtsZ GTPase activity inhibitor)